VKKVGLVVVLLAGLMIVSLSAQPPPKGAHFTLNFVTELSYTENLFNDSFDAGLSNWLEVSGTWGVIPELTNNYCAIQGGSYVGGVVNTPGSENWTNYSLEFDVQKAVGSYFNVVFRYVDAANHYLLEPSSDSVHIALFKKVGGGYVELTTPSSRPEQDTALGTWYHYKIVVQGPSIKIYVDGFLVIDVIDSALPAGKIGIGAYAGSTAYFDNVHVMGASPNEVLVAKNGTVPGLMYVEGPSFEILDNDAGIYDGDAAVLQLPLTAIYDVWCSARGTPGGQIVWGSLHLREDVPAGKPTWHQHAPDNFSLGNYGISLGTYPITTANDAAILATRWYLQIF